jgi:hypothetical protein
LFYIGLSVYGKNILRVFDSKWLGNIFDPMREAVTGKYRKLHNEEFHSLDSSPSIARTMKSKISQICSMHAWEQNKCKVLIVTPHWEDHLGIVGAD